MRRFTSSNNIEMVENVSLCWQYYVNDYQYYQTIQRNLDPCRYGKMCYLIGTTCNFRIVYSVEDEILSISSIRFKVSFEEADEWVIKFHLGMNIKILPLYQKKGHLYEPQLI